MQAVAGTEILFWRRIDTTALERLELSSFGDGLEARSTVIGVDDGGFELSYHWRLTSDWRTVSVTAERKGAVGARRLMIERIADGWRVDGAAREDLIGAEEPDISVTPFCNTLPIRRMAPGEGLTLDTCYLNAADMTVSRSRQRYEPIDATRVRYVDLGLFEGFSAEIEVDPRGLVRRYDPLFERIELDR